MNKNLMEQFSTFADQVGQPPQPTVSAAPVATVVQPTPSMQGSVVKKYEGSGIPETVQEGEEAPKKNNKMFIFIGVGVAILVIIGIVVYFVVHKKKDNESNKLHTPEPQQNPQSQGPEGPTYEDQVNDARAKMAAQIQANLRNQIASARRNDSKEEEQKVQVPHQTPSSVTGNAANLAHTGPINPLPPVARPQLPPQQGGVPQMPPQQGGVPQLPPQQGGVPQMPPQQGGVPQMPPHVPHPLNNPRMPMPKQQQNQQMSQLPPTGLPTNMPPGMPAPSASGMAIGAPPSRGGQTVPVPQGPPGGGGGGEDELGTAL